MQMMKSDKRHINQKGTLFILCKETCSDGFISLNVRKMLELSSNKALLTYLSLKIKNAALFDALCHLTF